MNNYTQSKEGKSLNSKEIAYIEAIPHTENRIEAAKLAGFKDSQCHNVGNRVEKPILEKLGYEKFRELLDKKIPDESLANRLQELVNAKKSIVTKNGVELVDDDRTSLVAIDLVTKMKGYNKEQSNVSLNAENIQINIKFDNQSPNIL